MSICNPLPRASAATNPQVRMAQGGGLVTGYGGGYSLVVVQFEGGETREMIVPAGTSLLQHLLKQMKEVGFLYLFNDAESVAMRADQIVGISMTAITKEGK